VERKRNKAVEKVERKRNKAVEKIKKILQGRTGIPM
jgi:hypothetical protein